MASQMTFRRRHSDSERGATLLELMVALVVSSIALSSMMLTITQLSKYAADQKTKLIAQLQAQSILDMMTPEVRMIGNGVPFHQANFLIGAENLSDSSVTEPILVSSATDTHVEFRINETGETYVVNSDYDPASSNSIPLFSVGAIKVGDSIYITNSVVDRDDGMAATVTAVNTGTNTITISNGATKVFPTGATFPMGSIVEVVPTVVYDSPSDWSGITRNSGAGSILLEPNSKFTISYLNSAGSAITLPLTSVPTEPYPANDLQNVRTLRLTVQVRSTRALFSTGATYTASATQSVAIRNFNYFY